MKKITIIGATGMLGLPVTRELIKTGYEIIALVRDKNKAQKYLPNEINFVEGDLKDKSSILKAIQGVEGLYLNLSIKPGERKTDFHSEAEGLDNILTAAKQIGIKRISYLAAITLVSKDYYKNDWWVMDIKRKAIEKIKNNGIPYTIFYPTNFMENLKHNLIRGSKINIVGKPLYKNWWIAGEDYGRQVAKSFQILQNENKEYIVQGPEGLMMEDLVDIFIRNYKKQLLSKSKTPMALLKFIGLFSPKLNFVTHIIETINNYEEKFESHQTWEELGKPTITIEQYAKQLS
ncbi:MAG: NmrA family NAD(P)-binding protein [Melioribacteraceae bacterium]|nr:NmrA family NAD(P)-binding protein [Melioribacteraceae bacterium]